MLRLILDSTAEAIYGIDLKGCCTFCNKACLDMLGYGSQQELLGQNMHRLIHHTRADGSPFPVEDCRIFKVLQHGEGAHVDDELLWRKDGSSFPTEYWSYPQRHDGATVGSVVTFVDITERLRQKKEIEQARSAAESANKAKSDFLASMSHEIRTPMNGVLGLAQLLEKEALSPDQRTMVQQINASGRILIGIINDILDFSKIEAGQFQIEWRPFALPQLLGQLDRVLESAARGKGLDLRIEAPESVTGGLIGDDLRVKQVLINLAGNAIKFTERGTVRVRVTPLELTETAARLRFEIHDTGVGIAPHVLTNLFAPFTQADGSITRRYGGTGLGLSISKRLVELMGGTIGAESVAGAGSLFWFELPFERTADGVGEPNAGAQESETTGPRLEDRSFLVVDDSSVNREVVRRALSREGADVVLAENGRQALDILRARPREFDAVLMDVQMPDMDGLTATRLLRSELGLADLPVVAFTAGVLPDDKWKALEAGVNGFLAKPVNLEEMVTMLRSYTASCERGDVAPAAVPAGPALLPGGAVSNLVFGIADLPGIDSQWLTEIFPGNFGDSPEFFVEMLRLFLSRFHDAAHRISTMLAGGDRNAALELLHAMRGEAGSLGMTKLARSAAELEQVIRDGQPASESVLERVNEQLAAITAGAAVLGEIST